MPCCSCCRPNIAGEELELTIPRGKQVEEVKATVKETVKESIRDALEDELESLREEIRLLHAVVAKQQGGVFRRFASWVCFCCAEQPINMPPTPERKQRSIQRIPSAPAESGVGRQSLLGPTVRLLEEALSPGIDAADHGGNALEASLLRSPFVDALEAYAKVLDQISSGQMGQFLLTNTKKLRHSSAKEEERLYWAWLLSELPEHAKNGFKGYLDDSAFMANLWIGRTMEFFVEMFALLKQGQETQPSCTEAYSRTLKKHHSFAIQFSFQQAVKRIPARQQLLLLLQGGDVSVEDVTHDIGRFVELARTAVNVCLRLNEEADRMVQEERRKRS
mmetsp:Transcript_14097/g.38590  ORF Transcript_14097/g.38590 Transcript_14097/m.38590 type:complete len:334 (-) Transcript_14097:211-1212(-)|eukprot:CAMPEP_0117505204 /NCGR_PEP_ID=MMETSP0784-20121206/25255_1 /TAXON_ID=39447 /ORGANISM="" /LENGTH=333 /DNA_ID=CAMNT_0005300605 /DNA_START=78 /DNA_END=1079 /DNA_ORIENTATION=-